MSGGWIGGWVTRCMHVWMGGYMVIGLLIH